MMEIVSVIDPNKKPRLIKLNTVQTPKPLVLSDAIDNTTVITPDMFLNKTTVLFLFRGYKCFACSVQISSFDTRIKEFKDEGIQVIGISSGSSKDLKRGLKKMNVGFPLYCDKTGEVFRDFGCMHGHSHGTFVINAQGHIKFQDVSKNPFDDIDEVFKKAIEARDYEL